MTPADVLRDAEEWTTIVEPDGRLGLTLRRLVALVRYERALWTARECICPYCNHGPVRDGRTGDCYSYCARWQAKNADEAALRDLGVEPWA